MNTIFSIIRNQNFIENKQLEVYINSLIKLDNNFKVVIVNSTPVELNLQHEQIETLNLGSTTSDLNIFGLIQRYLNHIQVEKNDYIIVCDVEKILFTRNPFSYLKHFDKDIYFYSTKHISNESNQKKSDFENFVKTCNYYLGNDFDAFSIESNFFAGKNQAFKALLLSLFFEVNRNSAHQITTQAVLSYVYKHFFNLFDGLMLNNQFIKIVGNYEAAESILDDELNSKKQYVLINP